MTAKERKKLQDKIDKLRAELAVREKQASDPTEAGWSCTLLNNSREYYETNLHEHYRIETTTDDSGCVIYISNAGNEVPDDMDMGEIARQVRLIPVAWRLLAENGLLDLLPE